MARSERANIIFGKIMEIGTKVTMRTEEAAAKGLAALRAAGPEPYRLPGLKRLCLELKDCTLAGMRTFIFNEEKFSKDKPVVVYLAGGCYMLEPQPEHFYMAESFAQEFDCPVYIPLYPKSVSSTFTECYDKMLEFYKLLLKKADPEQIIFAGDSAGGGRGGSDSGRRNCRNGDGIGIRRGRGGAPLCETRGGGSAGRKLGAVYF